jgi:hypothetical protein
MIDSQLMTSSSLIRYNKLTFVRVNGATLSTQFSSSTVDTRSNFSAIGSQNLLEGRLVDHDRLDSGARTRVVGPGRSCCHHANWIRCREPLVRRRSENSCRCQFGPRASVEGATAASSVPRCLLGQRSEHGEWTNSRL